MWCCAECAVRTHAVFQQLEVDYYIGAPNQQVFRTDLHEVPIIRMYGVTEQGGGPCACACQPSSTVHEVMTAAPEPGCGMHQATACARTCMASCPTST